MQIRLPRKFLMWGRGSFPPSADGSTMVEFSLVAPFIIVIILAGLQISISFLAKAYLETVTETAARLVQTNQANNMTQSQFQTAVCNQLGALFSCANLIVQLQPAPTSQTAIPASLPQFSAAGALLNPTSYSFVSPPAKMMLVVMYEWPVFGGPLGLYLASFSNGTLLMTSTQIFQIEPNGG